MCNEVRGNPVSQWEALSQEMCGLIPQHDLQTDDCQNHALYGPKENSGN